MYHVVGRNFVLLPKELVRLSEPNMVNEKADICGNNGRNEMERRKIGWNSVTKGIGAGVVNDRVRVANGGLVCRVTWCLYDYSIDGGMWWRLWYELAHSAQRVSDRSLWAALFCVPSCSAACHWSLLVSATVMFSSLSCRIKCSWKLYLCF